MKRRDVSLFVGSTAIVLLLFMGLIVALFAADISYVDSSLIRKVLTSPDERYEAVRYALVLSLVTSVVSTLLAILVAVPVSYALSRSPSTCALVLGLIILVVCVTVAGPPGLVIGAALAYLLSGRRSLGVMVLDVIVDALIVLPILVIGISVLVFFRQGADLTQSGFLPFRWVGAFIRWWGELSIHERPGIVLAQFLCSVPFAVRVMKATFDELDPRSEQVAMTLGCGRAGAFWRVTLPMAKAGLVAAAVLSWARAMGIFGAIEIVAGAVPRRTEVLATSIYLEISVGRLEVALAISIIMAVMAALVLVALRLFAKVTVFGTGGGR